MPHIFKLIFVTVFLMVSNTAFAQNAPGDTPKPSAPVIEVNPGKSSDSAIKHRIEDIFDEIDGLEKIEVSVAEGVVDLSGETASESRALKAVSLAERLSGVVTVEDNITRSLDVEENVTPVLHTYRKKLDQVVKALPLIALGLLIIVFFTLLGVFLSNRTAFWEKITPSPFLAELLSQAVRGVMFFIGVVLALDLVGADKLLTTILGGAGVLGIALGFAIRDTMENYISSILLSIRQPFRAKDHVFINEKEGIVVRLTSRATVLMTMDGNHLRIPNSEVFKATILNYTTNPDRRFKFNLGVGFSDDPIKAMRVGLDALRAYDFILDDPAPGSTISEMGESNIILTFTGWINQRETSFGKARSLAIRSVKAVLEDEGFTIPEPAYRLRFDPGMGDAVKQSVASGVEGALSRKEKPKNQDSSKHKETGLKPDDDLLSVEPVGAVVAKVDAEIQDSEKRDLLDQNQPKE